MADYTFSFNPPVSIRLFRHSGAARSAEPDFATEPMAKRVSE
jgi:hypothetical protein